MISRLRNPSHLFGVPFVIRRRDAQQLVDALQILWQTQHGQPMGELDADLDHLLARLFNPRITGARVRKTLDALTDAPEVRVRYLEQPLILPVSTATIVTPEGRIICDLLLTLLTDSDEDPLGIDLADALAAVSSNYDRYREMSASKLVDVVKLRLGESEGLRLPSLALLLLILINGSETPATAIVRPRDPRELQRLDEVFANAIGAFSETIQASSRNPEHFSLYSGYVITEARRRLSDMLGPSPDEIYIPRSHREDVIRLIARELRRPRRSPGVETIMRAFDELIAAYRSERPTLAALGVTFESRADTSLLRTQLEQALGDT